MYVEPFVLREKTLGGLLDDTIERYPDNDALVYVDRDYRLSLTLKNVGSFLDISGGASSGS